MPKHKASDRPSLLDPTPAERQVLRALAGRVAELAAQPEQAAKRRAVTALNRLDPVPPRIYCFPEGAWLECIPWSAIVCQDPVLRSWEMRLRMAVYTAEEFRDDQPLESVFNVSFDGGVSDYGLEVKTTVREEGERLPYYIHPYSNLSLASQSNLGAVHYESPLKDRADLDRLRVPEVRIHCASSDRWLAVAHDLFDGLLTVRRRCQWWQVVGGVASSAARLRGMDALMLDFYDDPAWVHTLLDRLADAHHRVLDQLEQGGWLTLNNGCEWIHTGGIGCSDELPAPGFNPAHVRCRDLWGGMESQDLVGISPAMFKEFFLPRLQPIVERFGLGNYGCCEPLHEWLPALQRIRNLRRVSVSPWADVRVCAERLGNRCIMSVKPLPTPVCTEVFDAEAIRRHLQEVFAILKANDCRAEIMVKDLHTVRHEPARLHRWVEAAQSARAAVYG